MAYVEFTSSKKQAYPMTFRATAVVRVGLEGPRKAEGFGWEVQGGSGHRAYGVQFECYYQRVPSIAFLGRIRVVELSNQGLDIGLRICQASPNDVHIAVAIARVRLLSVVPPCRLLRTLNREAQIQPRAHVGVGAIRINPVSPILKPYKPQANTD